MKTIKQVADWKFLIRIVVAIAALSVFLSAALAGTGLEDVKNHNQARKIEKKEELLKLVAVRKFVESKTFSEAEILAIASGKATNVEIALEGKAKVFAEITFSSLDLEAFTSKDELVIVLDKKIKKIQEDNKDLLVTSHSEDEQSESEESKEKKEESPLVKALCAAVIVMQEGFTQQIAALNETIKSLKDNYDNKIEDLKSGFEKMFQSIGLVMETNRADQFIANLKQQLASFKSQRDQVSAQIAQSTPEQRQYLLEAAASLDMQIQQKASEVGHAIQQKARLVLNQDQAAVAALVAERQKLDDEFKTADTDRKKALTERIATWTQEYMAAQAGIQSKMQGFEVEFREISADINQSGSALRLIREAQLANAEQTQRYDEMISRIRGGGGRYGRGAASQSRPARTFGDAIAGSAPSRDARPADASQVPVLSRQPAPRFNDGFGFPGSSAFSGPQVGFDRMSFLIGTGDFL
ncbi:MAG: hypothetical protein HYS98_01000 [Deltaproteobacteria bacterium]|nr:hypothetical protein [Deltaproteobacteria bacterium]